MSELHRIKLSDFKAKKELEGSIEIETDDGQVFRVLPPELWPDEVMALSEVEDSPAAVRLIIGGEGQYEAFVAAGGSAAMVLSMIGDIHGVGLGESSASSSS